MSLVVVRCPACRGQSRVETAVLGVMVQCPRCQDTFIALEEAELVSPGPLPRRFPELPPPYYEEPPSTSAPKPEPDHDPHRHPQGSLPVSVLIGLALLPFAIPILWMIAPAVVGLEPMLSWAVPLALAVSTSILCLAVIYTIDWSPATRVKGVLMMVGLAYFAAVNLYFLKKQTVDEVKKFFGAGHDWVEFQPADKSYQVKMPAQPHLDRQLQPMLQLARFTCYRLSHVHFIDELDFVVGASEPGMQAKEPAATDDWYEQAFKEIENGVGGKHSGRLQDVKQQSFPGKEATIEFGGHMRAWCVSSSSRAACITWPWRGRANRTTTSSMTISVHSSSPRPRISFEC